MTKGEASNLVKSDSGTRLARGSIVVLSADGAATGFGLLLVIYLARVLGATEFGYWTLAAGVVLWIEWSISSVFTRVTLKLVSEASDPVAVWRSLVRWQMGLALISTAVTIAAAPLISQSLHEPRLIEMLRWFSLDIPLFVYSQALRNLHIATGRFGRRGAMNVVRGIGRLGFIVLAVSLGWSVAGAIIGSIAATVLEVIVSSWGLGLNPFGATLPAPELWHYTASTLIYTVSLRAMDRLDLFLLKAVGGADAASAGAYAAAQNVGRGAMLIASAVSPLLLAITARLHAERNADEARRIATETLRLTVLSLPFVAIFAAIAPALMPVVFGQGYGGASIATTLLVFAGWNLVIIYLGSSLLTAGARPGIAAAIAAFTIPVALAGYLIFVPRWSLTGAAGVTTAALALSAACYVEAIRRAMSIDWPWKAFLTVLLVSAVSFLIVQRFSDTLFRGVLVGSVVAVAVIALLVAVRAITADDLATARALLTRRQPVESS